MFIDSFIFDIADDAGYYLSDEVETTDTVAVDILAVGRCVIDKLYIESGTEDDIATWDGSFPDKWGYNTLMRADFNNNLYAGSVDYSVDIVSEIRIKRRRKGDNLWKTIYIKNTETVDDFQFAYVDKLAAGNTDYEYMLVPLVMGEEGVAQILTVSSEFRDLYIIDREQTYHIVLDAANNIQYNMETASQSTIGRKYPFVIKNGAAAYYSGTVTAIFIELVDCEWDVENGAHYRKLVDEFLGNGNVKILKDWLGNMWMVSIIDNISQDSSGGAKFPTHTFSWVECGGAEDIGDLYDNGFINTQMDRE